MKIQTVSSAVVFACALLLVLAALPGRSTNAQPPSPPPAVNPSGLGQPPLPPVPTKTTVRYRVTDLGTLADCNATYANAVNDAGWIAGYAYALVPPGHGAELTSRPFAWHGGMLTALPTLGGKHGQALAVNARGDLAGYAQTADLARKPVIWKRAQHFQPTCLSEFAGRATCLLDDGTAGGAVFRKDRDQAVIWKKAGMQVLGNPRDTESCCNGINGNGIAVGMYIPEGHRAQSIWSPGDRHAVMWKSGQQIDLPQLGGALSECNAINDVGTAVGWSDLKDGRSACLWKEGKVTALPAPEGFDTEAHAINKEGVMVGEARGQAQKDGWQWLAFLWHAGKYEDLNRLIPAGSGWTLSVAAHISDNGLIVGYGRYNKYPDHSWRAFLLTPIKQ